MRAWADEVAVLVQRNGGNKRIAVGRLEPAGAFELRERGLMLRDLWTRRDESQAEGTLRGGQRSDRAQSFNHHAGNDVPGVQRAVVADSGKYQPYRYTLALHGTGMADEWPGVLLHPDFDPSFSGVIEEGVVLNVESLIAEAGSESIKLETQALITAKGAERLDTFPWEEI